MWSGSHDQDVLFTVDMQSTLDPMNSRGSDLDQRIHICSVDILKGTSSLKILGQFQLNYICSLQGKKEGNYVYLVQVM